MTPVAAVEKKAKTEHLKDDKEGVPFVKLTKGIKRLPRHSFKNIEDGNIKL